jgi:hypothetical protein
VKTILLFLATLISVNLEAATIKSIKGNKASLKLTPQELEMVETEVSYDLMSNSATLGRIKVTRIFPGKGVTGTLESKTNGLKAASAVKLTRVDDEAAPAEEADTSVDSEEETGIKPTYGRPEALSTPIGFQFGLLLGTHEMTSKDSDDSVYASNFSLRALYKFSAIPLGIGGHLKNNSIQRKVDQAEIDLSFTSLGVSVMLVHDFGNFRPYALSEVSSGSYTFTAKANDPVFGEQEYKSDPKSYLGTSFIVGGSYLLGKFSIGLEYQTFGQMTYKLTDEITGSDYTTTLNTTGFSLHLGLSI